jgi:60 kDa SS-A/Ro ribonucleoprotein
MVTARTEKNWTCLGFTSGPIASNGSYSFRGGGYSFGGGYNRDNGLTKLGISPRQRLDDIVKQISNLDFGNTDCALPMLYATENKLEVDMFQIFTDNETWSGGMHPFEALRQYRQQSGRNAKLVVNGMTATGFSIADPNDAGMLDVVGFDTSTPSVVAEFART